MCRKQGDDFDSRGLLDNDTKWHHFIGKNTITSSVPFRPAILENARLKQPTAVYARGSLTVNGVKMFKSRGAFILAQTYLNYLDPEYLRYSPAAKRAAGVDDIDLNLDDFFQRVNADLVSKVVNIARRCEGFLRERSDNRMSVSCSEPELVQSVIAEGDGIAALYKARKFNWAMTEIIPLAYRANLYIDEKKTRLMAKEDERDDQIQCVLSRSKPFPNTCQLPKASPS